MVTSSPVLDLVFAQEISALFLSRKPGPTDGDNALFYILDHFQEQAIAAAITQYASDRSAVDEFRKSMTSIINACPGLGCRYQRVRLNEGLPPLPLRKPKRRRQSLWSEGEAVGQADEAPM